VNGWVNVNNNHVVFPKGNENSINSERGGRNRLDDPSIPFRPDQNDVNYHSQLNSGNVSRNGDAYAQRFERNATVGGIPTDHGNVGITRPDHSPIYKPVTRYPRSTSQRLRGTSKLSRTNSHSDMLKEQAASKRESDSGVGNNNTRLGQSDNDDVAKGRRKSQHDNENLKESSDLDVSRGKNNKTIDTMNPSNFHIGPMGAHTSNRASKTSSNGSHLSSMGNAHPSHLPVTGQYVNENAFANQVWTKQLAAQYSSDTSTKNRKVSPRRQVSSNFHPNAKNVAPILPTPGQLTPIIDNHATLKMSLPPQPTSVTTAKSSSSNSLHDGGSQCFKCDDLNKQIVSLETDIECLRAVALNSEYVCVSCEKRSNNLHVNSASSVASGRTSVKSNKSKHSVASNKMNHSIHSGTSGRRKNGSNWRTGADSVSFMNENMALAESSQRLIDVTSRHKRQIEHMSRETLRWQNEIHLKLSKLAMMCKDLNDESAKRKEQVHTARGVLGTVREDNFTMASELDILRARIELYEKQEEQNIEIRKLLRDRDNETLSVADRAIKERDDIIEDLTTTLQQALSIEEGRMT